MPAGCREARTGDPKISKARALRLTQRDGQLLGHEMIGQLSVATGQLVSDLPAPRADVPYDICSYSCPAENVRRA